MHFKSRQILLTDANPKLFNVMNNAYYGPNLPKFFKNQRLTDEKIVI